MFPYHPYYRFGGQPYPYASNWQGLPWHSSKPPHLQFGAITPSTSEKQLLILGGIAAGAYLFFVHKRPSKKTLFQEWIGKRR